MEYRCSDSIMEVIKRKAKEDYSLNLQNDISVAIA